MVGLSQLQPSLRLRIVLDRDYANLPSSPFAVRFALTVGATITYDAISSTTSGLRKEPQFHPTRNERIKKRVAFTITVAITPNDTIPSTTSEVRREPPFNSVRNGRAAPSDALNLAPRSCKLPALTQFRPDPDVHQSLFGFTYIVQQILQALC